MNTFFASARKFIAAHRWISAIGGIVIVMLGYNGYKSLTAAPAGTQYTLAAVQRGTLISSLTGSGQVSAYNQVDLKPKASGDLVYLGVTAGQDVKAGTLIAQLDTTTAEKAVRDAEINLQTAQIALNKLAGPSTLTTPLNKQQAIDSLATAYDDGFSTVSNTFVDLPAVMSGLQGILFNSDRSLGSGNQLNVDYFASAVQSYDLVGSQQLHDDAIAKYQAARAAYDQNFTDYKSTSRASDTQTIESLVNETYTTTKEISDAVKSASNLIQFYEDKLTQKNLPHAALADTYLSDLSGYTSKANGDLSSLLSSQTTIQNDTQAVANADLDLQSQQLSLTQKQNALADAKAALADYYVYAPFDGTIAQVDVKKLDSVGSGTVIATLITHQKIAEVSLNEVDVSKVAVGQKVTLTFDAIDGLSIAGTVSQIDTIGTVSQGVVTYNVQIAFDTQDTRVKPGMSVNATIITDVKQNVLMVPNGAVKTQGTVSYVEIFDSATLQANGITAQANQSFTTTLLPNQVQVQTGTSNDTSTEIVSGLSEGDLIVSRSNSASSLGSVTTTTAAPSLFGGGGGGARFIRGG
ncbi:MAG: HlyD family efflux transporter periplasmic adaptor subunit [Patescibacteria group bacterium]|nr:HlyD family efflux transporter periplasmic adaptor subunit [Patescibacteria group bacterium]